MGVKTMLHVKRVDMSEFILWPTVKRPILLGIGLLYGAHDQNLSLSFIL
jgi:hypothetical protein